MGRRRRAGGGSRSGGGGQCYRRTFERGGRGAAAAYHSIQGAVLARFGTRIDARRLSPLGAAS
jgi:hypothetical protein